MNSRREERAESLRRGTQPLATISSTGSFLPSGPSVHKGRGRFRARSDISLWNYDFATIHGEDSGCSGREQRASPPAVETPCQEISTGDQEFFTGAGTFPSPLKQFRGAADEKGNVMQAGADA